MNASRRSQRPHASAAVVIERGTTIGYDRLVAALAALIVTCCADGSTPVHASGPSQRQVEADVTTNLAHPSLLALPDPSRGLHAAPHQKGGRP